MRHRIRLLETVLLTACVGCIPSVSPTDGRGVRAVDADAGYSSPSRSVGDGSVGTETEEPFDSEPNPYVDLEQHPAGFDMLALIERGVLQPVSYDEARPDDVVTRGEFARMLVAAFLSDAPDAEPGFRDVPSTHPAAAAIGKARAAGYLRGDPDGRFRPDEPILRVEVIAALVQGLGLFHGEWADVETRLDDAAEVPAWARDAVGKAWLGGLFDNAAIHGPAGHSARPLEPATRAVVAVYLLQSILTREAYRVPDEPGADVGCDVGESDEECRARGLFVASNAAPATTRVSFCASFPSSGWLRNHEAGTGHVTSIGHTIACHVGWTDEQLRRRLFASVGGCSAVTSRPGQTSTYRSVGEAENVIVSTVLGSCSSFLDWLTSPSTPIRARRTFTYRSSTTRDGRQYGRMCLANARNQVRCTHNAHGAVVVIQKVQVSRIWPFIERSTGAVLTSYPQYLLPISF